MVGFNAWDEEWEVGGYGSTTGTKITASQIRSANKIRVIPNTSYYLNSPNGIRAFYYDLNETFIESVAVNAGTFTIPASAYYMTFQVASSYGTTYNNDICINLAWDNSRNGEYKPYISQTYPISDIELRGIPTLDNGKIKYDGDEYLPDGTVTRRYGVYTFTGNEEWTKYETAGKVTFNSGNRFPVGADVNGVAIMTKYPFYKTNYIGGQMDKTFCFFSAPILSVCDNSFSDATAFAESLAGSMVIYPLATPTTETADPYTSTQWVDKWGTEEFIDSRDVPMPVGNETVYQTGRR